MPLSFDADDAAFFRRYDISPSVSLIHVTLIIYLHATLSLITPPAHFSLVCLIFRFMLLYFIAAFRAAAITTFCFISFIATRL